MYSNARRQKEDEGIEMKHHLKRKEDDKRMRQAGHVKRMVDEWLSKRAWETEEGDDGEEADNKTWGGEVWTGMNGWPLKVTDRGRGNW